MTIDKIYIKFDKSINWNGFFYVIQKILSAIFTFILFKKLSTAEFSTWINVNSIIFLTLLWMDFGFRKSVPRFVPEFSKNQKSHISFTKFIIKWQAIALLIVVIFLTFKLKEIISFLGIEISEKISYLAIGIFLFEAPIALLKLIYHAHFWNRYFNILYSVIILIETSICLILLINTQTISLANILTIKIIAGFITSTIGLFELIKLFNKAEYLSNEEIDHLETTKSFVKHSSAMWFNNTLKSLSERNFLVPMITYVLGAELANIFKIANDWALVFQRSIVKTIGTTDTSLFSYVNIIHKDHIQEAFTKITRTILRICIPLFVIFLFLLINKNYFIGNDQIIFRSFLILVAFYVMETILSPYERILEVNKEYLILLLSYLPFVVFIYLFFANKQFSNLGLELFIVMLCIIRLISSLIFMHFAKQKYNLKTPIKDLINLKKKLN
jgi:O-antigen/teichoic acid export membrane protein